MPLVATVVAILALGAGVVLGLVLGTARRRAAVARQAAAGAPPPRTSALGQPTGQPLASLVVEALDHGVVVVDREERAILANPAARRIGAVDADGLALPQLTTLTRRVLESGEQGSLSMDLPPGRRGREPIALSVTAVPLPGADDRIVAVCLLLADMSDQRRLDAVRRDFVANVSHELKTPVGALTLLAEAIQDAADDPEAVHRFATRIQHEGSRLARLVVELMELSRVQGADPMPGSTEVDVRSVVSEAVERTRLAAEQAEIAVTAACAGGDLRVRGNESQLAMAVANLVENAVAYSGSGTRVVVTARMATDEEARPVVEISVTDQGIGIAEAEHVRIFERFYRVDPARSRATGGTGLGLAIVKNIVTNHLGEITLWSVEGSGSTFTVRLPRVHSDGSSSATSAPELSAERVTVPVSGAIAGRQITGRASSSRATTSASSVSQRENLA